jgi:hypothetical protein
MAGRNSTLKRAGRAKTLSPKARAEELVDFIQNVALGKKKATAEETDKAIDELRKYLPDLLDE